MDNADSEQHGQDNTNDSLVGNDNLRDWLTGGGGNDSLDGLSGNDTLEGGAGNDSLLGKGGSDSVAGGAGADTIVGGGGNDTLDGGDITDRTNYSDGNFASWNVSGAGAVTINLQTGTASDGFGGTDTLVNINFVQGGSGNDSIQGSSTPNLFERFEGLAGNDTIDGGAIDLATQNNGNRVVYSNSNAAVSVTLNGTTDGTASDGLGGTDVLRNINQVTGSNFNDTLVGSNSPWTETFEGGRGADSINGGGGIDILRYDSSAASVTVNLATGTAQDGWNTTDTFAGIEGARGGSANDTLLGSDNTTPGSIEIFQGNAGSDSIDGGAGYDRIDFSSSTTGVVVTLGGSGTGSASDGLGGTDTFVNIEGVRGSDFNDTLTGSDSTPGIGFESFEGRAGNDSIDGKGGIDRVDYNNDFGPVTINIGRGLANDGFGGTDWLKGIEIVRGSQFSDSIVGSFGNETISGGPGNDTISGGATATNSGGADMFSFAVNEGTDLVTDFGTDDTIEIRGAQLGGGTSHSTQPDMVGGFPQQINSRVTASSSNGITSLFIGLTLNAGQDIRIDLVGTYALNGFTYGQDTVSGNTYITYSGAITAPTGISGSGAVDGTNWNDTIAGSSNADTITGGSGNDSMQGLSGNDSLSGGAGADTMSGGSGNDTFDGGAITDRSNNTDRNLVSWDDSGVSQGATIDLQAGTATDGFGNTDTLVLSTVNFVQGTSFGDSMQGSSTVNLFEEFEGKAGNDTIDGGAIDLATGSNNNRASYLNAPAGVSVTLGLSTQDSAGNVTIGSGTASDGYGNTDTLRSINHVRGSAFNDTLTGSNTSLWTEQFEGGAGNDSIVGNGGTDIIRFDGATTGVSVDLGSGGSVGSGSASDGLNGTDTFTGIEGVRGSNFNDTLAGSDNTTQGSIEIFQGAAGNDSIDGKGGFDRIDYQTASFGVMVDLAAGTAIDGQGGKDTFLNIEAVRGSDFNDLLLGGDNTTPGSLESFEGRAGNDTIDGRGGFDRVDYSNDYAGVHVDLSAGTAMDGFGGMDVLLNVEGIRGSNFDDVLTGNAGNNTIAGQNGNDTIDGGLGSDTLTGGGGIDTFVVSNAVNNNVMDRDVVTDLQAGETIILPSRNGDYNVTLLTGSDPSTLTNGQIMVSTTQFGSPGNNNWTVSVWADVNDQAGADVQFGIGGLPQGFTAKDLVVSFSPGDGPSGLLYRPAGVTLAGGSGDDFFLGSNYVDSLTGGDGNDILVGYQGNDTLDGGNGDDHFGGDPGSDSIIGGAGFDMVHYDFRGAFTTGIVADLSANTVTNGATGDVDTLSGIEGVSGTAFADTLVGSTDGNDLEGSDGSDSIDAGAGNDTVWGGAGDDTIVGGTGDDQLSGMDQDSFPGQISGADTFKFAASGNGNDTIIGFDPDDVIKIQAGGLGLQVGNTGTGGSAVTTLSIDTDNNASTAEIVLTLQGQYDPSGFSIASNAQAGTSTITFSYPAVNLSGTEGNDSPFNGGLGNDTLNGLGGNDSIDGNVGNDSLAGGAGFDTLVGGPGNDTLDGGDGFDYVQQGNYSISSDGVLADFNTHVFQAPGLGVDAILNIEGAFGSYTNDTLNGDGNDNYFDGLNGNDILSGGGGNDLLQGNFGNDTLTGGAGADIFDVKEGGGGDRDVITDLASGDIIQLAGTPNQLTVVNAAASTLLANQVSFSTTNGVTTIAIGIDNTAGADHTVDITGTFTAADFLRLGQWQAGGQFRFGDLFMYSATAQVSQNLAGTPNPDVLLGSNQNDTVAGADSADTLYGFDGNDLLQGGNGGDDLRGGFGNDTLDGGADIDVANYSLSGSISINANLVTGVVTGEGTDSLIGVEGIAGPGGNDTLVGDNNSNQLAGNWGNDSISGGGGDDWISAGPGNDTMTGGTGIDVFSIDQGNNAEVDVILDLGNGDALQLSNFNQGWTFLSGTPGGASLGQNQLALGAFGALATGFTRLYIGTDNVAGADRFVDLQGSFSATDFVKLSQLQFGSYQVNGDIFQIQSSAPQTINGTGASETLTGAAGNDTINGFAGGDLLIGNGGDDSLSGGDDGDFLQGGTGNDTLDGGNGFDTAQYAFSATAVSVDLGNGTATGEGNDSLLGIEQVIGSNFADTIVGSAVQDTLLGMDGNDSLSGGNGDDRFDGGTGNDTFDGGQGNDIVQYGFWSFTAPTSFTVTYTPGQSGTQADGQGGVDTLVNIEEVHVFGGSGNDSLNGGAGREWLEGNQGNDILTGNGGGDTFAWQPDMGNLGRDLVNDFGTGDSLFFRFMTIAGGVTTGDGTGLTRGQVAVLDHNNGTSTLAIGVDSVAGADLYIDLLGSYSAANFSVSNDTAGGNGMLNLQQTGPANVPSSGNDTLTGTNGNDSIDALAGDDSVDGGGGDDTLIGNAGNDTLLGGVGNDRFEGQAGNDSIVGGSEYDIAVYNFGASSTAVTFTVTYASGTTGTQADGFGGIDTLTGVEELQAFGGTANDVLAGGSGREFLEGNQGDDTLSGNGGGDTFAWQPNLGNLGRDRVTDFGAGDSLHFRFQQIGSVSAGDGSGLLAGQVAVGAYNAGTNTTTVAVGTDSVSGADLFIDLTGQYTASNFSVYNDTVGGHGNLNFFTPPVATEGNDNLTGSGSPDSIDGLGGNDVISGLDGNDTLQGGNGDDFLDGGTGNDSIDGGASTFGDTVGFGSATTGVNVNLAGNIVNNDGTGGVDTLASIENANGTPYNDTLVGNSGNNFFRPGAGNDSVSGNGNPSSAIDFVSYEDASAGVMVNLQLGTTGGAAGNDTLSGIQGIQGSWFNDTLTAADSGNGYINGRAGNDSIQGGSGNDNMAGGSGSDTLNGGNGTDNVDYSAGTTQFDGGPNTVNAGVVVNLATGQATDQWGNTDSLSGFENVSGSDGADSITGNGANNFFTGNGGNDTLDGGAGSDGVGYNGATTGVVVNLANTTGTDGLGGTDTLLNIENVNGTGYADNVTGNGSNNSINTGGGNDTIDGGSGDDFLTPGSGNDSLVGGAGTDTANYQGFLGGSDTDPGSTGISASLVTGLVTDPWGNTDTLSGIEQLFGTNFNDTLVGGNPANGSGATDGFEGFRGNGGNDSIDGGTGYDRLLYDNSPGAVNVQLGGLGTGTAQDGWGGTDTFRSIEEVRGGDFNDTLLGSSDNVFESFEGRGGNDSIDGGGGTGTNRLSYQSSTGGVNVNMVTHSAVDNFGGTDTFANIQAVRGGDGNDTILGDAQDNNIEGRLGNDSLSGGDGQDSLLGGAGDDVLNGGSQRTLAGWDATANTSPQYDLAIYSDASSAVTVTLGTDGTAGTATGGGGNDTLVDIEMVIGSDYDDVIRGTNRGLNEIFRGGKGNDTIYGGASTGTDTGNNFLDFRSATGTENVDMVAGTANGADGSDTFSGIRSLLLGDYNDTVLGDGQDNYVDAGAGNDSVDGGAGNDAFSFSSATSGVTASLVTGSSSGGGGSDTFLNFENMRGSEYGDILTGSSGDNRLQGRAGADQIDGGGGNDTIHGGHDNDTLTGGAGNDQFQYGAAGGEGIDEITDFSRGDVIRIDALLAGGAVTAGSSPGAKGVQAQVTGNSTMLWIDTDGNTGAEIQILLDGAYDISKFAVTNNGGAAQITYDTPLGSKVDGMAYYWKSHVLLDNVAVTATAASAVASNGSDLFDLRGLAYDASTNSVTAQVWINPTASTGAIGFTLGSAQASTFSFTPAPTDWTFLANSPGDDPHSYIVQGFINSGGGVTASTQVGTVTINLAPGTTSTSFNFSGINVGETNVTGFSVGLGTQTTGLDGQFHFTGLPTGDYGVSGSRGATDMGTAINSADALAALRIAVGINPNTDPDGAGPLSALKLSPYQVIAADANKDGKVNSADSLAILRMAVKAGTAPANEWLFVNEKLDLWDETAGASSLTRNAATWANPTTSVTGDTSVNFVGVLKGDVNGSWVPAANAGNLDLDNVSNQYFQLLGTQLGVPTDVWGV